MHMKGTRQACVVSIGGSKGGGACRPTPPLQDPILSFSHTFSLKSAHVGGQNPPKMGPRPPPTENPGSGPGINIISN